MINQGKHSIRGELVQRIKNSGANAVFLGLGCPRQETWAYEYRNLLKIPILAVGAAFDFHAGTLTQAIANSKTGNQKEKRVNRQLTRSLPFSFSKISHRFH
jgi:exopolysaccharide biosynthesis WecB/TagA/CpsF family protein